MASGALGLTGRPTIKGNDCRTSFLERPCPRGRQVQTETCAWYSEKLTDFLASRGLQLATSWFSIFLCPRGRQEQSETCAWYSEKLTDFCPPSFLEGFDALGAPGHVGTFGATAKGRVAAQWALSKKGVTKTPLFFQGGWQEAH